LFPSQENHHENKNRKQMDNECRVVSAFVPVVVLVSLGFKIIQK